jgi:hypothetical protein
MQLRSRPISPIPPLAWLPIPLILVLAATLVPAKGDSPTGNSATRLYYRFAGKVPGNPEIPYILASTRSPSSPVGEDGTLIGFVPRYSVPRDEDDGPLIYISDPVKGGDLVVIKDGKRVPARRGKDVASLVADGTMPETTKLLVTIQLHAHDDMATRRRVLRTARSQIGRRVEEAGGPVAFAWLNGDESLALENVVVLPATSVTFESSTPGTETFKVVFDKCPSLGRSPVIQAVMPASFVAQAYSPDSGVFFNVNYEYEAYADSVTSLVASRVAKAFLDAYLQGEGHGGLRYDKAGGAGEIKVLTSLEDLQRISHDATFREDLRIQGASLEEINLLLGYLQGPGNLDIFSTTAKEVEDLLNSVLDLKKTLNEPSVANVLDEASSQKSLNESDHERLHATMKAISDRVSKGRGFSFAGFGGGKTDTDEHGSAEATKDQQRTFLRSFLASLNTYRKEGTFKIHPDAHYRLVSPTRINKQVEQRIGITRAGQVSVEHLATRFGTSRLAFTSASSSNDDLLGDVVRNNEFLDAIRNGKPLANEARKSPRQSDNTETRSKPRDINK